jgi:predicted dehydrogenase
MVEIIANSTEAPVAVTIAGSPPDSDRLARAFRSIEGVSVRRIDGASEEALVEHLSEPGTDALVLIPPVHDLTGIVRRALMTRRHVLVAGSVALAASQLRALETTAHARGRTVMFDTPHLADARMTMLRKMTQGPAALWRPRYVRSLRTGADHRHTLDEIAIADISSVLAASGGMASNVSAVVPRIDDESGVADVVMMTMTFDGGPVARMDVCPVEPDVRREITVACDGRTFVLDDYNARAPMLVQAARHRGPRSGDWGETISEFPRGEHLDRAQQVASAFVDAVRAGDAAATNVGELAVAAMVWETARESMAAGGELLPLSGVVAEPSRPVLQLIRGRGRGAGRSAAALRLVDTPEHDLPLRGA